VLADIFGIFLRIEVNLHVKLLYPQ
jgi:hypothetical protein